MKSLTFKQLKYIIESEENFEDEAVDSILYNLKMFKNDITFVQKNETENYIELALNSQNPIKARNDLTSYKFSHATNLILEPIKRSKGNGVQVMVYDEDGDPFDKELYIIIRKGGQYNAGVENELNFTGALQTAESKTIKFKDKSGKELVLNNVESIRDCSKDPGSRTGNRADVEITLAGGKKIRISLKKDSAYKIAGLIKKFANESYRIGKIVRKYFIENNIPFSNRYITIPITNLELYRWCVFGNDMQKDSALIQGNFSNENNANIERNEDDTLIVNVDKIVVPTDLDSKLMQEFPIYLFMEMNKHGGVKVISAVIGQFGKRYLLDGLVIPGINDIGLVESKKEVEESKPSDYGEYFFHGSFKAEKY